VMLHNIHHDARSPERQILEISAFVGFIIRIFHDARSPERKILEISASSWFCYKNLPRCTVT